MLHEMSTYPSAGAEQEEVRRVGVIAPMRLPGGKRLRPDDKFIPILFQNIDLCDCFTSLFINDYFSIKDLYSPQNHGHPPPAFLLPARHYFLQRDAPAPLLPAVGSHRERHGAPQQQDKLLLLRCRPTAA